MKIYNDSGLENEVIKLNFGIVDVGTTKDFTFYVVNDVEVPVEALKFEVKHSEITITKSPQKLKPGEMGRLELTWNPKVVIKQGLNDIELEITTSEIWG